MKQNESKHIFSIIGFSITILLLSLPSYSKELPKIGKENKAKKSKPGISSLAKPKPDFGIVSIKVKKVHNSGSNSMLRYGNCYNQFNVVAKNSGDAFKKNTEYDFIQHNLQKGNHVRIQHIKKGVRHDPNVHYFNLDNTSWSKGQYKTKTTKIRFETLGTYQIKTIIQACWGLGYNKYEGCLGLNEKNKLDNIKNITVSVTEPCL